LHSDLAKKAIADAKITQEELEEVKAAYVKCLTDGGLTATVNDDGTSNIGDPTQTNPSSPDFTHLDEVNNECLAETDWSTIDTQYITGTNDPDGLPFDEVLYNCLVEHGAIDKNALSYGDFAAIHDSETLEKYIPESVIDSDLYQKTCNPYALK
jgi:hypothetical protein